MILLTGVNRYVSYSYKNRYTGHCILLFPSRIDGVIKNIDVPHLKGNLWDISFSWCDLFLNGCIRNKSFISQGNLVFSGLPRYQTLALLAVWIQILQKNNILTVLLSFADNTGMQIKREVA